MIEVDVSLRGARVRAATFVGSSVRVGRSPDCELVLDNLGVSRHHASLLREGDGWVVEDLGSANGTFVNGARVGGRAPLRPGDVIGVGKLSLVVRYAGAGDGAAPRARPAPGAHLLVRRGEPAGVVGLDRDVLEVGAHRACGLRLLGALAPRRLALVARTPGGHCLVNVTRRADAVWRNGAPVSDRAWLEDGDRLELLDVLATFRGGASATPPSTRA